MKLEALHVGMSVRHPQYGLGTVKTISEHTADILFEDGRRTIEPVASELQPAEAQASVTGLDLPLGLLLERAAQAVVKELGLEKPESFVEELAARWHGGRMVLHPTDPTLQTKEVPLEVFFHKIVMMRNNFRTLEMKLNANEKLTDAEKVELQQYIHKCYGSMTTYNLLFRSKAEQFESQL